MRCLCLYYSATGNTEHAVDLVRRGIEAAGGSVDVRKVRRGTRFPETAAYDALIVAFPVLSFAPPAFIGGVLKSLPQGLKGNGSRTKAYVLAVDGGGGRSAAAMASRLLDSRGYEVVSSARATYPENWVEFVQPSVSALSADGAAAGDGSVERFTREVLSGKAGDPGANRRVSMLDGTIRMFFSSVGRRFFGKLFYADGDCNACGLCVRRCPAGTILLKDGPHAKPFWKSDCESCNACMNLCPKQAINTSIGRIILLALLVIALAGIGIWAYVGPIKAAVGWNLPAMAGALLDITAVLLTVILAHVIAIGPVDRFLLRFVQRIPGLRRFFAWTFTKHWRRYRAVPESRGVS